MDNSTPREGSKSTDDAGSSAKGANAYRVAPSHPSLGDAWSSPSSPAGTSNAGVAASSRSLQHTGRSTSSLSGRGSPEKSPTKRSRIVGALTRGVSRVGRTFGFGEDDVQASHASLDSLSKSERLHVAKRKVAAATKVVAMAQVLEKEYSARMFNRAVQGTAVDAHSDSDKDRARTKRLRWMLLPNSRFHSVWDSLSLLWIFLNILTVPYWVAFNVETGTGWLVVDIFIDVWFCMDIILNFRTAYVDDGDLQTDAIKVAKHYLTTSFALDLLATFPFSLFLDDVLKATAADRFADLPTLFRMVRLVRLVKIIRLLKAKRNFGALAELGIASRTIMRVLWLAFWMTAIGHVLGCFWVLVFMVDSDPNGWAVEYGVDPEDHGTMYLSALYFTFATLTTVGFGDVSARTNAERVYALVMMLVGAVLFATIVGRISALATAVNRKAAEHQAIHDSLAEFMRRREIPKPLRQRLRAYFQYKIMHNFHVRDDITINELSPALRREVLVHMNKGLIAAVPFLRHAQAGFVNHIVTKLHPVHCIPKDYIIMAGEVGDNMYLLRRGDVDVISKGGYMLKTLHSGSFFGEIACLYGCPRTSSVRARTAAGLLSLSKDDLLEALAYYPSFAEGLAIVAQARRDNIGPEQKPGFDASQHRCATPPMGLTSWSAVHKGNAAFHARALQYATALLATDDDAAESMRAEVGGDIDADQDEGDSHLGGLRARSDDEETVVVVESNVQDEGPRPRFAVAPRGSFGSESKFSPHTPGRGRLSVDTQRSCDKEAIISPVFSTAAPGHSASARSSAVSRRAGATIQAQAEARGMGIHVLSEATSLADLLQTPHGSKKSHPVRAEFIKSSPNISALMLKREREHDEESASLHRGQREHTRARRHSAGEAAAPGGVLTGTGIGIDSRVRPAARGLSPLVEGGSLQSDDSPAAARMEVGDSVSQRMQQQRLAARRRSSESDGSRRGSNAHLPPALAAAMQNKQAGDSMVCRADIMHLESRIDGMEAMMRQLLVAVGGSTPASRRSRPTLSGDAPSDADS